MTRKEQKEYRRQQILETALTLFVHQGFHGTKTSQISREAGISEGLLFHYFPTKESLLEELVRIGVEGMRFPLRLHPERPIDFFEQFTGMLLQELLQNPFYAEIFVLMAQVLRSEGIPKRIQELAGSVDTIALTVPVIEAGQKDGSIREGDPLALSNLYWCTIQGIAEQYALHPQIPLPEPEWIMDLVIAKQ